MSIKKAVIIGAGPAGLTAAYELIKTGIKPVILESAGCVGGISRTVDHRGNRIDIGGHRFFSKSPLIMSWWLNILPLEASPAPDPETTDRVMLLRPRSSRILYRGKMFDYPLSLSFSTLCRLGPVEAALIAASYAASRLSPPREERSLEDFFINRFGERLYRRFFKDYTEKVWGLPCDRIDPSWGAQRVKSLSVGRLIAQAARDAVQKRTSLDQRDRETSLIRSFLYPKFGPGQLWEAVADEVRAQGGEIRFNSRVTGIRCADGKITGVESGTGYEEGDVFFSSMPVQDLIKAFGEDAPENVRAVARGLSYRGLIVTGLLFKKLLNDLPCNWIYIQEKGLLAGRLQIFNNWSPYLARDRGTAWVGLEYFCTERDGFWDLDDSAIAGIALSEMEKTGLAKSSDLLDSVVIREPKAYHVYTGAYGRFGVIRDFAGRFPNLFLIGRNGMHRYNNMDHSMLSAIAAVGAVGKGPAEKDAIWEINTEGEHLEQQPSREGR